VPFDDLGLLEKKLGAELFSSLDIKSDSISFRASTYNSQKPKFYIFVPKDNLLNGTAWLPIIYFFSLAREAGALETLNSETFEAVRQKASIVGKEHCNSVISGLQKLLDSSQNLPLPGRTDKLIINPELINNLKLILETL
jgi:hypothetical protein